MDVDVLVPTFNRPQALAVTLAGLAAQTVTGLRVVVSEQSDRPCAPEVAAAVRILRERGYQVALHRHQPPRGMAEQRAFLLALAKRRHVLFLDDDVWLAPAAVEVLREQIDGCGFVGFAVQGLSYRNDVRPEELKPYEEWAGPVRPERVRRGTPEWRRHTLHNAANPTHLAERTGGRRLRYKVAWIGGCVMYDREKLEMSGGFDFWPLVPPRHAGEDVVAQLRVMERYGGAGVLPSLAYHLELPTTVPHRDAECYDYVFGER